MNLSFKKDRGKSEGSVLFTVTIVMFVMVTFLMSTLILTTSANRRSFYTYYQTQAQYVAQAGLDAVTNAAYSNKNFYEWLTSTDFDTVGEKGNIDLDFASLGIEGAVGRDVSCTVERVDPLYVWDADTQHIHQQDSWKITVTASVGTGRNTSSYTACNYIYANYKNPAAASGYDNKASWTYKSGITETAGTTPGGYTPGTSSNLATAITSYAPSAASNNMVCLGPNYVGTNNVPGGWGQYSQASGNQNDIANVGKGLFVGSLTSNTHILFQFQHPGEGTVVYGDMAWTNNSTALSECPAADLPKSYNKIPYVYVDGELKITVDTYIGNSPFGKTTVPASGGTNEQSVNMYLGSINFGGNPKNFHMRGDMFLYNPYAESELYGNLGTLSAFVYNNVSRSNYGATSQTSGNIVCNNSKLTIKGSDTISGDLIMSNTSSTLVIDGNVTVEGPVVCAGNLKVNGSATFKNGVYVLGNLEGCIYGADGTPCFSTDDACNHATSNTPTSLKTNSYGDAVINAKADGTAFTNSDDLIKYIVENPNIIHADYPKNYIEKVDGNFEHPNYCLMPYGSRMDQIHERYYYWGIKVDKGTANAESKVQALLNSDPIILESRAAGNAWSYNDIAGYYVPYTDGKATNKALNQVLSTYEPAAPSFWYPQDLNDYLTHYSATGLGNVSYKTQSVKFYSHNADGAIKEVSLNNCKIVTDSGIINGSDIQGNGNERTIFIDPTYGDHTDSSPLVLVLRGTCRGNIIINNSTFYPTKGNWASGHKDYADDDVKKKAGRREVVIYLDEGFCHSDGDPGLNIVTTGCYQSLVDKKFDVISNPVYPEDASWAGLGAAEKYKYQMISNTVIYAHHASTINCQMVPFFNAEVIAPETTFWFGGNGYYRPDTNTPANFKYREFSNSDPFEVYRKDPRWGGSLNAQSIITMGTMVCYSMTGQNMPVVVYLGDELRTPGTYTPGTPTRQKDETTDDGDTAANNTVNDSDYFTNDHQGAN